MKRAALLALLLTGGCASLPPVDLDVAAHLACLAACSKGTCAKVEGVWTCVVPPPDVPPPDVPPPVTPPPVVPPPPVVCSTGEADLSPVDPQPAMALRSVVAAEVAAMGNTKGQAPRAVLDALAARLRAQTGRCVISGQEAIFIQRDDKLWEEYHAVYFGDGSLIPGGKPVGVHRAGAPEPPPAVDYGCGAPRPDRVWTAGTLPPGWGQDAIGTPRWRITSMRHGQWIDTTALVTRNEPHCRAIGMSPMADGTPRGECPPRPDGHPERLACEAYLAEGAWVIDSRDGAVCEQNPDNPAQFRRTSAQGACALCNPSKTVCSAEW